MNVKLSVVIPVYNVEKYLEKCVNKIINQHVKEMEIILVDDGSTDNSGDICDKFSHKYKEVKSYHKENGGASDARNFGLKKAIGEYVWFVDSDDTIEDDCIKKIESIIIENNPDVIVCQSKVIHKNGVIEDECKYTIKRGMYTSNQFMDTMKKNPQSIIFCPQYYIVKRDFVEKNKIYFYKGIIYEDELWIPQLLLKADSIFYSNLNIYFHLMRDESVMHSTKLNKCGMSAFVVSEELLKIYDNSNRKDLQFLRDRNANIFLQSVWKMNDFFSKKSNIKRLMPIKNSYYLKTRLKALLYLISPRFYLFIHKVRNKIKGNDK